ncbi:MAG: AsmA family protein, partial [Beijerinckiaceae bacterium]
MGTGFSQQDSWVARYIAAAVCLAAVITMGLWPWSLSRSFAETQISALLRGQPGEPKLKTFGTATFSALPWPSIRVHGLEIDVPTGPVTKLAVARLDARIGLGGWSGGAARIVSIAALGPHLTLRATGRADIADAGERTVRTAVGLIGDWALRSESAPEIRIDHGVILDADGPRARAIALRLLRQGLGERSVRAAAEIAGETYRLALTRGAGTADEPRAMSWSATGAGIEAQFDGALMQASATDARGRFRLRSTPSPFLRRWSEPASVISEAVGEISLEGDATLAWPALILRNTELRRGNERHSGSLEIMLRNGVPSITAILHAPKVDLSAAISGLTASLAGDAPDGRTGQQDIARAMRLDLRLSTDILTAQDVTLRNAAMTAALSDGRLELTINEAQF